MAPPLGSSLRVPRPTRHNPFKPGSHLARQYAGLLAAYANGSRDLLHPCRIRNTGSSLAGAFWRGYDGATPNTVPRSTLAWAAYRAGQTQRLIDAEHGSIVPA